MSALWRPPLAGIMQRAMIVARRDEAGRDGGSKRIFASSSGIMDAKLSTSNVSKTAWFELLDANQ